MTRLGYIVLSAVLITAGFLIGNVLDLKHSAGKLLKIGAECPDTPEVVFVTEDGYGGVLVCMDSDSMMSIWEYIDATCTN